MEKKSKIVIDLFDKAEFFSKEIDALYVGKIEDVSKIHDHFKGAIYIERKTRFSDQWDSLFEKLKERVLDQSSNYVVSLEQDKILNYSVDDYLKQVKKNLSKKKILMYGDDQLNTILETRVLNNNFYKKNLIETTKHGKKEDLVELLNQNKDYDLILIAHPIFGIAVDELVMKVKKVFIKHVALITSDVLAKYFKERYLNAGFDYFIIHYLIKNIGEYQKLIFSILEDSGRPTDRERYLKSKEEHTLPF